MDTSLAMTMAIAAVLTMLAMNSPRDRTDFLSGPMLPSCRLSAGGIALSMSNSVSGCVVDVSVAAGTLVRSAISRLLAGDDSSEHSGSDCRSLSSSLDAL